MLNPLVPSPGLYVVDEYYNGIKGVIISLEVGASDNYARLVRYPNNNRMWVYDYNYSEPRTVPFVEGDWSTMIDLLGIEDLTPASSLITRSLNRNQLAGRAYLVDG